MNNSDPPVLEAPYGTWTSPITAEFVVAQSVGLDSVQLDGDDLYWIESRPYEKGRCVIVRRSPDGRQIEINPAPYNARSRVHEYGGGAYAAFHGTVYFSNVSDNGIYEIGAGESPRLVTNAPNCRFADLVIDELAHTIIAVCEEHSEDSEEPTNSIVRINLADGNLETLVSGADFYASIQLSPDSSKIAWLSWHHPNMPWDSTELFVADITPTGAISNTTKIAGGDNESVFQPEWSPTGILYFVSDRSGWWNLYRLRDEFVEPVWPMAAEFGLPQWVFGQSTYAFVDQSTIFCAYSQNGVWHMAELDCATLAHRDIQTQYTVIGSVEADNGKGYFIGGSPSQASSLISIDLAATQLEIVKVSSTLVVDEKVVSVPTCLEFPTSHGQMAFAIYYPAKNDRYRAPHGALPPLLVACHGGPTSASYPELNRSILYWTSRGFAYVQVNYGGSTGYGREFRERLNGQWGIVDVEDCVYAARFLADSGLADPTRLTIHGGSAGGYDALAALTFFDLFAAGASLYGVSDLEALALDTHKFESKYMERLVGPYPSRRDLYIERSPIHFAEKLSSPVIFFQGLDDKVVPPSQAQKMVDALKLNGIAVAYIPFAGEGHGFRNSDNIKRCIESMLYFYGTVLNIPIADKVDPVEIWGVERIGQEI